MYFYLKKKHLILKNTLIKKQGSIELAFFTPSGGQGSEKIKVSF